MNGFTVAYIISAVALVFFLLLLLLIASKLSAFNARFNRLNGILDKFNRLDGTETGSPGEQPADNADNTQPLKGGETA